MYAAQAPGYHPGESRWQDYRHFFRHADTRDNASRLPDTIKPWLLDNGSLTKRLVRASGGQFRVKVLNQQWQQPRFSERRLLDMGSRETSIVREVLLLCFNEPWVFARSVIPARSVRGHLRQLRKLSDSSLGAMLFSDPSMQRHPFELALIDGNSPQLPTSLHSAQNIWGRRCRFELAGHPLMVSEIFLPTFRP